MKKKNQPRGMMTESELRMAEIVKIEPLCQGTVVRLCAPRRAGHNDADTREKFRAACERVRQMEAGAARQERENEPRAREGLPTFGF
jgi:hypothetical protein